MTDTFANVLNNILGGLAELAPYAVALAFILVIAAWAIKNVPLLRVVLLIAFAIFALGVVTDPMGFVEDLKALGS